MNILTAPVAFLLPPISSGFAERRVDSPKPAPPDATAGFIRMGTLLALLIILGGFYFIFGGEKGDIVLSGNGFELRSGSAGIAMVVIGALFYLGLGWIIIKK